MRCGSHYDPLVIEGEESVLCGTVVELVLDWWSLCDQLFCRDLLFVYVDRMR